MRKYSLLSAIGTIFIGGLILMLIWAIHCAKDRKERMINEVLIRQIYLIEKIITSPFIDKKEEFLKSLEENEEILYIKIEDRSLKRKEIKDEIYQGAVIKSISFPLSQDKIVRAGVSLRKAEEEYKSLLLTYSVVGGIGIIFIIGAFFFLLKEIISPIKEIERACREIEKGDLEVKIKKISRNEIGDLISAFNRMVRELRESRTKLEESRTTLEIRVKARTKELEELNQSLEEKVKERTKELQERIDELERFHRLTVGRELKMIELKKKIKELEEKLSYQKDKTS